MSDLLNQGARPFASCNNLAEQDEPVTCAAMHHNWTLSDAVELNKHQPKLPLASFNHVSRECLSLEKSRRFYIDILGFREIPRPPFDCDGMWLVGYGLNLHLVATSVPSERQKVKLARIHHFSSALPRVDHIAFLTYDLDSVREVLDKERVYYNYQALPHAGIYQIFMFDPDGNVIEISNCAPPVGETTCLNGKSRRATEIEADDISAKSRPATNSMCSDDFYLTDDHEEF